MYSRHYYLNTVALYTCLGYMIILPKWKFRYSFVFVSSYDSYLLNIPHSYLYQWTATRTNFCCWPGLFSFSMKSHGSREINLAENFTMKKLHSPAIFVRFLGSYKLTVLAHFQAQNPKKLKKKKKTPEKSCLYFQKWKFLTQILKKFLYFLKIKLFLYSPKTKLFLYFQKWNFLVLIFKKLSIFSQKIVFLMFPKTLHFSDQALKIKELHHGRYVVL